MSGRLLVALLLVAGVISFSFFQFRSKPTAELPEEIAEAQVPVPSVDTIRIAGVGDIMMGSDYPNPSGSPNALPPQNGATLLAQVKGVLSSADVTFGNLEGVLIDKGKGTPKGCINLKYCYIFRSPEKFVNNLVDAGFDVMSLANNHASDFGEEGRKSSMRTLEASGIAHAGFIKTPYTTFKRGNLTYGFAAFAPNTGCVTINDHKYARSIVQHLDSISDIVIVSFHGGAEGTAYQHVPRKHELYIGEDRGDVYQFSHDMIDAGADVVFGHGPHITRAVEVYNKRFIAYSMGNFCTYASMGVDGVRGLAPIVTVFTDTKGNFFKAEITPTYQTPMSAVMIDPKKRVIKVIQELTLADFPEKNFDISDDGVVTLR
jgi:poly-gamma-glutamate capsule biosynthesis protein CapA/YwtB (metallophosphatase superfamily)